MDEKDRGIALIMTLWILAILVVLSIGVIQLIRGEARVVQNFKADAEAYNAAKMGVFHAISILIGDDTRQYDSLGERWAKEEIKGKTSNRAFYEVTIRDEGGKININTAHAQLLAGLDFLCEEYVNAILDWRDLDHDPRRRGGAEDDFYRETRRFAHESKDLFFDSLSELRLIKRPEDLQFEVVEEEAKKFLTTWGKINIRTAGVDVLTTLLVTSGAIGDIEEAADVAQAIEAHRRGVGVETAFSEGDIGSLKQVAKVTDQIYESIKPYITVEGGINVNTAKREVLEALFESILGVDAGSPLADAVILERSRSPFKGLNDLEERLIKKGAVKTSEDLIKIRPFLTVRSKCFAIESIGWVDKDGVKKRIDAIVIREVKENKKFRIRILSWCLTDKFLS